MQQPTVVHSTFTLERTYAVSPDRVFAAFADPAKKRRWSAEGGGCDVDSFTMDFRVGGTERADLRFREGTPFPGVPLINSTIYLDIVPDRRIVFSSAMTLGERRISATLVTFEFLPSETGTDLICTHQGAFFEGSDGPDMRQAGWRSLLDRLGQSLAQ